ncbi:MAG: hypothetical protein ABIO70_19665 [Pseudomonadota bacterium]
MIPLALLGLGAALAGQWLPEVPVQVEPGSPWLLQQAGGVRSLLQVEPAGADLQVWCDGLRIPLKEGPGATWLLPADDLSRTIELRAEEPLTLRWWRESDQGEPQAWDRWERALHRWAEEGGELPPAPGALPARELEWRARRDAMEAAGELDPELLFLAALLEVEPVRARSWADHGPRLLAMEPLAQGEVRSLELTGPGVLTLRSRARMDAQPYRRYALWVVRDGLPQGEHALFTTEDVEGHPGWGFARGVSLTLPPGEHLVQVRLSEHAESVFLSMEAEFEAARPSLQALLLGLPHARPLDKRATHGPVGAMERAWLLGDPAAMDLARQLLGGPASDLARARLVEGLPEPADAVNAWQTGRMTPLTALALARRWRDRRDVDPAFLLEVAALLPPDPALLSELADALPQGFVRPRGRAIRSLAGFRSPGTDPSRWTQLAPEGARERLRVEGVGGGLDRVRVRAGMVATIQLPEPALEGHFPVLRMEAEAPVAYRVDGALREGLGTLDEALSPGDHQVEVERGALVLMDAALVLDGGEPMRDKAVGPLPNRWLLPDPGAPGELEVVAWGPGGRLVVSTDDGQVQELETEGGPDGAPALTRAVLALGPQADALQVEGPEGVLVGVALRRNTGEEHPAVPGPWPDPIEYFHGASRAMVGQTDPRARAELRLQRAAAYHVLGLLVSAQREARAVAAMPDATPEQRAVGLALYQNTVPPVHTAEFPGPVTVDAALAWAQVPNPGADGCEDLVRIAGTLLPPVSWPVNAEASRCFLARGAAVDAWVQAAQAGPLGRVARLKAADAGDWHLVSRVDLDGGTFPRRVQRRPPEIADGLAATLQELSLGAPWGPTAYTVVRDDHLDAMGFTGEGELALALLCRDESFAVEPGPCHLPLVVDGARRDIEAPDSEVQTVTVPLGPGRHDVRIGPLEAPGQALAVYATLAGQPLPPQVQFTVHRLGSHGVRATVAGPTLLRVRAHEHGPVMVSLEGREVQVDEDEIVPVTGLGPVRVAVTGSPEATVTLSALAVCHPEEPERPPLPRSLDHNLPQARAVQATDLWMREVATPPVVLREPMGQGGTIGAWVVAGDDATGMRDATVDYRYGGAGAGWYQRLDGRAHWLSVEGSGRASVDGAAGALLLGQWVHTPGPHQVRVQAEVAGSGGAGHAAARATWRYLRELNPWWSLQPYAHLHAGWWSGAPAGGVDPAAWSTWSAQHVLGLDLGVHADWRPLRDLRLRLYTELDGNPTFTPDGLHLGARLDALPWQGTWLLLGPNLTVRFPDPDHAQGYARAAFDLSLSHAWYPTRGRRWDVSGRATYYPFEGNVEGMLGVDLQLGPARGLRDQSPFDQVFTSALDLPLEQE